MNYTEEKNIRKIEQIIFNESTYFKAPRTKKLRPMVC